MMSSPVHTFPDKAVAEAILAKMQKRHPNDVFVIEESAMGFTVARTKDGPKTALEAIASITVAEAAASFQAHLAANPPKPVEPAQVAAPKPKAEAKPKPAAKKSEVKWKPALGYYPGVSFKMAAPFVDETEHELFFTFNGKAASALKKDIVGFYVENGQLAMKMPAAYAKKRGFL
jgi:hypothetical protein